MKFIQPAVIAALTISMSVFFFQCKEGIDLFSLDDDKNLGLKVRDQILNDSTGQYHVLSEAQYPVAYQNLRRIRDKILNSGNVAHKDDFTWECRILQDDNTLNAFCAPGGYIFVYTGIIKYLDHEDDFAGVLGHEIGHADNRHTTKQMTKVYGIQTMLDIVLGKNQNSLTQVAEGLVGLQFSRDNETEADKYSVIYLSGTDYACNGAATFFQKLIDSQQAGNTPAFLSTHPSPDNRIAHINAESATLGCGTTFNTNYASTWQAFKASLP